MNMCSEEKISSPQKSGEMEVRDGRDLVLGVQVKNHSFNFLAVHFTKSLAISADHLIAFFHLSEGVKRGGVVIRASHRVDGDGIESSEFFTSLSFPVSQKSEGFFCK